jgi:uncharacterized membrane protein YbhN (UPF0104 family)
MIWLAVRSVDLGDVGASLRDAAILPLLGALLLVVASYPLLALRWQTVARGAGAAGTGTMLELVLVGAAVNNALPGRLGEVARAYGLSRATRQPIFQSFGTVVVDRVADALFFALCLGSTFALAPGANWVRWVALSGAALAVVGAGGLVAVALVMRRRGEPAPQRRIARHLWVFARGLSCIRSPRAIVYAGLLTVAAWGVWMIGAWLVARSLGIHLSAPEVIFTTGALGLGSAVPSAPGYVGTYDWLAASSLGIFGVAPHEALAFAVLLHAVWFIPTTLAGAALLARHGMGPAALRRASARIAARV